MALGLGRQGRHAEAEAAHREALALAPEHPAPYRASASLWYWQGLTADAERAFEIAIRFKPDHVRAHR